MDRRIVARVGGLPIDQMGKKYYPCYGNYREGFGSCIRCDCKDICNDITPLEDIPELKEKEYLDLVKHLVTFKKQNNCIGNYGACAACILCSEQIRCEEIQTRAEKDKREAELKQKLEESAKLADLYALQQVTDKNFEIINAKLDYIIAFLTGETNE